MRKADKVLLTLLLVFGCFVGSTVAAEPTLLSVMMEDWGDAEGRKVFLEKLVPAFEKTHPGVKVDVKWTDWNTYVSKYVTWFAGGVMPDVISIGSSGLGQFASQGMIQPIDTYVRGWSGMRDMVPPAIEDGKYNGKIYSIAYRLDVRTLIYNKSFVAEAGLPATPPRTWDNLLQYAKRLVRKDGAGAITREGFDVRAGDLQHVLPFIFQNGGGYISADGKHALLAEQPVVEALEYLHSLIYEHGVATPNASSFIKGTTAMIYDGTWLMDAKLNPIFSDTGFAEPNAQKTQATQMHINKYAISSTSKSPDLAWEWIAFVMEPENLALASMGSPRLTPRVSPLRLAPFNSDLQWGIWLTAANLSKPIPGYVPRLAEVVGRFNKALSDIIQNKTPIRARLEDLVRDLDTNLLAD
jgi:multiple sugar transport system substrate-binding protein